MTDLITLAREYGFEADALIQRARARLKVLSGAHNNNPAKGRLFVVCGVTPPRGGVGKTSAVLGIVDGLNKKGIRSIAAVRHTSLGEFVERGFSNGTGHLPRVVPEDEFALGASQDAGLVATAQNILAAIVGNAMRRGECSMDPALTVVRRAAQVYDRSLREWGFELAGSSELMAILALIQKPDELATRIGQMVIGYNTVASPIRVRDLKAGALIARVVDEALWPTWMQTAGGSGCLVHTGTFAHTSLGSTSTLADRTALGTGAVCVTETGYGSELGLEKFFDIKVRTSGLDPERVILVATLGALKEQDAGGNVRGGQWNLGAHIEIVRRFGHEPVVLLNVFEGDREADIQSVLGFLKEWNCTAFAVRLNCAGHPGMDAVCEELAAELKPVKTQYLYPLSDTLKQKIETIAQTLYGAEAVAYSDAALRSLHGIQDAGFGQFPVLFVKNPFSLSHEPQHKGRHQGYTLPVKDISYWAGAGVVRVDCGGVPLMPSMSRAPQGVDL